MRYKLIFLLTLVMGLFPRPVLAAEVDEVIWKYPGYDVTVHRTGKVRVDFILNQQGISRESIESRFGSYPTEKFREYVANPEQLKQLFRRIDSADWIPVKVSYRAAEGTFEYAGHEVVTTLILKSKGVAVKQVEMGSSRKSDWPSFLREISEDLFALAGQDGRELPRGPFLD